MDTPHVPPFLSTFPRIRLFGNKIFRPVKYAEIQTADVSNNFLGKMNRELQHFLFSAFPGIFHIHVIMNEFKHHTELLLPFPHYQGIMQYYPYLEGNFEQISSSLSYPITFIKHTTEFKDFPKGKYLLETDSLNSRGII